MIINGHEFEHAGFVHKNATCDHYRCKTCGLLAYECLLPENARVNGREWIVSGWFGNHNLTSKLVIDLNCNDVIIQEIIE